jgi:hypothetical protein
MHGKQFSGGLCLVAFLEFEVVAEDDCSAGIFFEVEGESHDTVGKLNHFAGHHAGESVNPGDPVSDFEDASDFSDINFLFVLFDLFLNDGSDFVGVEFNRVSFGGFFGNCN